MVGGDDTLHTVPEILDQTGPVPAKNADFYSMFARTASALTPSEQEVTNRKSTTHFPMSLR